MAEILGSGIAFPLQVDRRGGIALAHDETDVDQAIQLILGTAPGERPMRPEFGCGVIRSALDRWEPRVEVQAVEFDLAGVDRGELLIGIDYRLRHNNHMRNLVYPFYVIPAEDGE
jgi:phage baseplate assembly protein W